MAASGLQNGLTGAWRDLSCDGRSRMSKLHGCRLGTNHDAPFSFERDSRGSRSLSE